MPEPEFKASDGTVRKEHYGSGEQPWDRMVKMGIAFEFACGNVMKYMGRNHSIKGTSAADDHRKAAWYALALSDLLDKIPKNTPEYRRARSIFQEVFYNGHFTDAQRDYLLIYGSQDAELAKAHGIIVDHETATVMKAKSE